ncbi:SCP2 sterol-binding domain-containing protein [Halomonas vilamensis]|uniref:Ubiquinone biosynthesis accessory factor UbiJ n=1 Tax=Vreelandella vilamensis TaxID=531309 RepID=A0ABU1GZH1_9GAMM|nr:SCP2 sterol-binding domain-containing protein [Halomonas vilamensis]MDR5897449.1 SCP2 sterol-binding domain-containing protein [Halomonas vilamensis]
MLVTPALLLAGCERTLNALLARDPAAPARLDALAGSRLLIRFEQPHLQLLLHFHRGGIDLLRAEAFDEADADAVVELTPETLSEWISGATVERLMFEGKLSVRGRTYLLESTRELLTDLDIDWEGELARWLGATPAHSLAEGLRRAASWGLRAKNELMADVSEYVFEEARLLPGPQQRRVLRDHLTELEVATDRLEARLKRLHRRLTQHTSETQDTSEAQAKRLSDDSGETPT